MIAPAARRLTVSDAGHPTGWLFRADTGAWARPCEPVPPAQKLGFVDLPMGIGFTPTYTRHRFRVSPGDRMLLFSDGVLETTSPDDTPFDTHGIETLLSRDTGSGEDSARWRPRFFAGGSLAVCSAVGTRAPGLSARPQFHRCADHRPVPFPAARPPAAEHPGKCW